MNDHDAIERQLAETMQGGGRPSRPVDVPGIVHSAVSTRPVGRWSVATRRLRGDAPSTPAERGVSMFSALKLVVGAAIVALFGSFLLSGALTTREAELVPATTTDELIAGLATEEVEAGVLRVISDGHRDLYHTGRQWMIDGGITVGTEATVWVYDGLGDFYRVGGETDYDLASHFLMDFEPEADSDNVQPLEAYAGLLEAGPDGRLWLIASNEIFFLDPELDAWEPWNGDIRAAAMALDGQGTVWATLTDELVRFDADATPTRYPLPEGYREIENLMVSRDGVAHVTARPTASGGSWSEETDALRLADDVLVTAATEVTSPLWPMAAGPEGVLWTGGSYDYEADEWAHRELMRLDESGWTTFTAADGIEPWGGKPGFFPMELIAASSDGSVWVDATKTGGSEDNACDGLGRFDGDAWISYLPGHCIADIDFTPDGDAWVLAEGPYVDGNGWGVFLVRP